LILDWQMAPQARLVLLEQQAPPAPQALKELASKSKAQLPRLAICLLLAITPAIPTLFKPTAICIAGRAQLGLMLAPLLDRLVRLAPLETKVLLDPRGRQALPVLLVQLAQQDRQAPQGQRLRLQALRVQQDRQA
jgi:hypothetical protein